MRILHVLPTRARHYGGPVRVAEELCGHLEAIGHIARVMPQDKMRNYLAWPRFDEVNSLNRQVRWAEIVHVHGLWAPYTSAAAIISRQLQTPYVIAPHGMLAEESLARSRVKKRVYGAVVERRNIERTQAIHCLSSDEVKQVRHQGINSRAFVLPNGVSSKDLAVGSGREERHAKAHPEVLAVFIGRLHPLKGLGLLLEAMKLVADSGGDLRLTIAGPDEAGYRSTLESLGKSLGVADKVVYTGEILGDRKRDLLRDADLFVLSSQREADSMALKEAMAAGLPVVVTKQCAPPDIESEGLGIVVDSSPHDLARALVRLAQDGPLRKSMGDRGRRLVSRLYSWKALAIELSGVYEDICDSGNSSPSWA